MALLVTSSVFFFCIRRNQWFSVVKNILEYQHWRTGFLDCGEAVLVCQRITP